MSGRLEYLHEDSAVNPKFGNGQTPIAGTDFVTMPVSQDAYSATLTVAFNIWDNLLTRVEYRVDDLCGASVGSTHSQVQNEISLNAVYSF